MKYTGGNEHRPEVSKLLKLNFNFLPKTFLLGGTTNTQPV